MVLIGCSEHANFKSLQAFECQCPDCGHNIEVFSDELDQDPACEQCGAPLDRTMCRPAGSGNPA